MIFISNTAVKEPAHIFSATRGTTHPKLGVFMKTIVIIGTGPAGLAAAAALSSKSEGNLNIILFESGKDISFRDHDNANELGVGLGGAGLFSDGKFSFFPSGTEVYRLDNKDKIKLGEEWLNELFLKIGINISSEIQNKTYTPQNTSQKHYPSIKTTLDQRKNMVNILKDSIQGLIFTNTHINQIIKIHDKYIVYSENNSLTADAIIFATGKFGSLNILNLFDTSFFENKIVNIRYELGIRIESPANRGFLVKSKSLDVKHKWKTTDGEARTFCTCRNGQISNISNSRFSSISGRSEENKKSEYSNFGLLLRFTGANFAQGKKAWEKIMNLDLLKDHKAMWQTLPSFINKSENTTGEVDITKRPWFPKNSFQNGKIHELIDNILYDNLLEAIHKLIELSPDLLSEETVIIFPAVEGVGTYIKLDDNLKLRGEMIWCSGDMAGKFRGLIPSLLSGFYVGLTAFETINNTYQPRLEHNGFKNENEEIENTQRFHAKL